MCIQLELTVINGRISTSCDLYLRQDTRKLCRQIEEVADTLSNMIVLVKLRNCYQVSQGMDHVCAFKLIPS